VEVDDVPAPLDDDPGRVPAGAPPTDGPDAPPAEALPDPGCVRSGPPACGTGDVASGVRVRSNAARFAGSPISSQAALIAAIRFAASGLAARSG
jgi:hypothetical protein